MNWPMLPRDGDCTQVTIVSLLQRVTEHELDPMRARVSVLTFEKYRPINWNLKLPLELYAAFAFMSASVGSGYEYSQPDCDRIPELSTATVWLRPQPDELSAPAAFWYPGAFIDKQLSELHVRDVTDENPNLTSSIEVLKKRDADEMFKC